MMRFLLSLVLLASAVGNPFQPLSSTALRVRGGAGPIDPELAGKVLTGAALTQGTSMMLAPKAVAEAYGRDTSPLSEICTAAYGAYVTAIGVMGYALLINKSSVNGAIGAGIATITLGDNVRSLLNGFPAKHGMNKNGLILNTLFLAFTAYALLTNQEYASNLTKALCGYGAANALFGSVSTVNFATFWGIDEDEIDAGYVHVLRLYCWTLLAFVAMAMALLTDTETLESIAYSAIIILVGMISQNFITKDTTELGMKAAPQYAWMASFALLIASILLPAAKESSPS